MGEHMGDLKTVRMRLPAYQSDRTAWRTGIFAASRRAAKAANVTYGKTEKLDVVVSLNLSKSALGSTTSITVSRLCSMGYKVPWPGREI
jgi:hypothetical protein